MQHTSDQMDVALEAKTAKSNIDELMAKLADLKVEFNKAENIKINIVGESSAGQCKDNQNFKQTKKENIVNNNRKRQRKRPKKNTDNDLNIGSNRRQDSSKSTQKDASNKNKNGTTKTLDCDPIIPLALTPVTKLIYELLIMSPVERDKFIYKQAKERRILIRNTKSGEFEFNPKVYGGISSDQVTVSIDNHLNLKENEGRSDEILKKNIKKDGQRRSQKNKSCHFETEVNNLLYGHDDLTEQTKQEAIFLYNENVDKKDQLFSTIENQINLEQFIEKLIEKDLGYIVEGQIRINQKNIQESYVINNLNNKGDILVPSIVLRQCALHGDVVKVFAINPNVSNTKKIGKSIPIQKDYTDTENEDDDKDVFLTYVVDTDTITKPRSMGFVLKIIEKINTRKCVGTFKTIYKATASTFKSRDTKLPIIKINPIHMPESLLNQIETIHETDSIQNKIRDILYYAEIIYSTNNELFGRIIKPIGKCGELEIENQAILMQNGLDPIQFSEDILLQIPTLPFEIPEKELLSRLDLRDQCIFTIDPATARDLDDAVSSKVLPNGNYEIGVHISDVSHFVKETSDIDELIKNQTTSIYLVDKVYHMLPEKLCFLCSLTPGDDKLALSVIWEITKNGEILKTVFKRSVINSCSQLSYDHAQSVIENPDKKIDEFIFPYIYNNYKSCDLVETVKQLNTIALVLRQQRFENGALRIDQPKLKLNLDHSTGKPISYYTERQQSSNYLIEDFMLLANQSVAAFIFEKFPDLAVLRKHDSPNETGLMKVVTKLSLLNLNLDISSSKSIRESLDKLPELCQSKEAASSILNCIVAKQMTRAKYICSDEIVSTNDLKHYALSIPIYTHFTSPIRRYPDILVHRLLCAGLNVERVPERTPIELNQILKKCNQQKMNAKSAGDDSANLYFMHYLKAVKTLQMRAAVLDIMDYYMEIIIMETGHILKIKYKKAINNKLKYCQENNKPIVMVTSKNLDRASFKLQMFSECWVEIFIQKEKLLGELISSYEN